jgi:hypothetical protein
VLGPDNVPILICVVRLKKLNPFNKITDFHANLQIKLYVFRTKDVKMLVRNLVPEDKSFVEKVIAGEPTHTANTWDWYNQPGTKSVVVADEEGAVLVAKFTPVLRMDTDFSASSPERIKAAIVDGLADMEKQARAQGFHEIVFESESPKLIAFCKTLGYEKSPSYRKVI